MKTYTVAFGGERLDRIARKLYGQEHGAVEVLLDANPGLSAHFSEIPGGDVINVPEQISNKPTNDYQLAWE